MSPLMREIVVDLAGAVGAEEGKGLAALDVEGDVLDGEDGAIGLGDVLDTPAVGGGGDAVDFCGDVGVEGGGFLLKVGSSVGLAAEAVPE